MKSCANMCDIGYRGGYRTWSGSNAFQPKGSNEGNRSFGVRRQSEAATAFWLRSFVPIQSGVALRLPPDS
jgi:hypothetical protein